MSQLLTTRLLRDGHGKIVRATPGGMVETMFLWMFETLAWNWTIDWMARCCLQMAQRVSCNAAAADQWIERYQAVRGLR